MELGMVASSSRASSLVLGFCREIPDMLSREIVDDSQVNQNTDSAEKFPKAT